MSYSAATAIRSPEEYMSTETYRAALAVGNTRETLIGKNAKLAERIARNFAEGRAEEALDLESEAYVGLVKAIDTFDPSLGAKFSTYATHKITGQVRHYLRDRTSMIREPGWLHERERKIKGATARYRTENRGSEPTAKDLTAYTGMTEDEITETKQTVRVFRTESLEAGDISPDSSAALGASYDPTDRLQVRRFLGMVAPGPRNYLVLRYFRGYTPTEIGGATGEEPEKVTRKIADGLRAMRRMFELFGDGAAEPPSRRDSLIGRESERVFGELGYTGTVRGKRPHPAEFVVWMDVGYTSSEIANGYGTPGKVNPLHTGGEEMGARPTCLGKTTVERAVGGAVDSLRRKLPDASGLTDGWVQKIF